MNFDLATVTRRARFLAKLKVPFVHQGTSLEGIDCVGALAYIVSYDGPIPAYPRDPVNGELETELTAQLGPPVYTFNRATPLSDGKLLHPGDILSIQYKGPIRHVAVALEHISIPHVLSMVHTDSDVGYVIEHIIDSRWLRRIVKVWRA